MSNIKQKVESYRDTWISLFKGILYLLWFFWALQAYHPLKELWVNERQYQKNRDPELERKNPTEVEILTKGLIKEAYVRGTYYSPVDFFSDLKKITIRCKVGERSVAKPIIYITQLQELFLGNVKRGYFSQKEVLRQRNIYLRWIEGKNLGPEEKRLNWKRVSSWLGLLYLKTMFLATILYFARMGERKGILATVLADKKKFVLAIMAWPLFLYKYPYNIVREIRVEAELRRIKGLFKKLSLREIGLVREIANSSNYYLRIESYHKQHKVEPQRGLFVAILATLFIHIFFVSSMKAKLRSSPERAVVSIVSVKANQSFQENDNPEHHNPGDQYLLMEEKFSEPPLLLWVVQFVKEIFLNRYQRVLDHIPRNSLFSVVN